MFYSKKKKLTRKGFNDQKIEYSPLGKKLKKQTSFAALQKNSIKNLAVFVNLIKMKKTNQRRKEVVLTQI